MMAQLRTPRTPRVRVRVRRVRVRPAPPLLMRARRPFAPLRCSRLAYPRGRRLTPTAAHGVRPPRASPGPPPPGRRLRTAAEEKRPTNSSTRTKDPNRAEKRLINSANLDRCRQRGARVGGRGRAHFDRGRAKTCGRTDGCGCWQACFCCSPCAQRAVTPCRRSCVLPRRPACRSRANGAHPGASSRALC